MTSSDFVSSSDSSVAQLAVCLVVESKVLCRHWNIQPSKQSVWRKQPSRPWQSTTYIWNLYSQYKYFSPYMVNGLWKILECFIQTCEDIFDVHSVVCLPVRPLKDIAVLWCVCIPAYMRASACLFTPCLPLILHGCNDFLEKKYSDFESSFCLSV